jgi:hypothetical protein
MPLLHTRSNVPSHPALCPGDSTVSKSGSKTDETACWFTTSYRPFLPARCGCEILSRANLSWTRWRRTPKWIRGLSLEASERSSPDRRGQESSEDRELGRPPVSQTGHSQDGYFRGSWDGLGRIRGRQRLLRDGCRGGSR